MRHPRQPRIFAPLHITAVVPLCVLVTGVPPLSAFLHSLPHRCKKFLLFFTARFFTLFILRTWENGINDFFFC